MSLLLSLFLMCSTHWHAYGSVDAHLRAEQQLPVYNSEYFSTRTLHKNREKAYDTEEDEATPTDIAQESEEDEAVSAQDERTKYEAIGMMVVGGGYVTGWLLYYKPESVAQLSISSSVPLLFGTMMLWYGYQLYNNPSKENKKHAKRVTFWIGVTRTMSSMIKWSLYAEGKKFLNNDSRNQGIIEKMMDPLRKNSPNATEEELLDDLEEGINHTFFEGHPLGDFLMASLAKYRCSDEKEQQYTSAFADAVNESNTARATSYTPHDILNMGNKEVRSLYRRTSINIHPDQGGSNEDFIRFKNSFDNLWKVQERRKYVENTLRHFDQRINRNKTSAALGAGLTVFSMLCFN